MEAVLEEFFQDGDGSSGIGVGQCAATDGAESQLLHLRILMGKHALDGANGVVAGELSKKQSPKPTPAVEAPCPGVAVMPGNDCLEFSTGDELNDLGKNGRRSHRSENLCGVKVCRKTFLPQAVFRPFYVLYRAPNRTAVASVFSVVFI